MNTALLIARNTLRQTVRERIYVNVALFGAGLVLFSMLVGNVTFGYTDRVVRSIGHSGLSISLNLLALLVGVTLVHQEIERRSLFVLLTRPVSRGQYILGRYLGLLVATCVVWLGLGIVLTGVLLSIHGSFKGVDLAALLGALAEAMVLGSIGVLLSTLTTPTVGAGMGLGAWLICATTDNLVGLTEAGGLDRTLATILSYTLPSLAQLSFREVAVYQLPFAWVEVAAAFAYAAAYAIGFLLLATASLSRREMV